MTLEEMARKLNRDDQPRVPPWTLGAVHRRSITFATGFEDRSTFVVWVQAHGMTGDLRIHPLRPNLEPRSLFDELDLETLVLLASVEGGTATTALRPDGLMTWTNWIGFQPYDKYPEAGILRRVGDCMIEHAPSGMYVEDWRFQKSAPGLVAGLRLVSETDRAGTTHSRAGGLVIAGDHAIQSIARRDELPDGTRAQDCVRTSTDPALALARVMDCTVDYATRQAEGFTIHASTDPRRTGQPIDLTAAFELTSDAHLIQHIDHPEIVSRLWQIDSLTTDVAFSLATEASPASLAWLQRERDTLIDPATNVQMGKPA